MIYQHVHYACREGTDTPEQSGVSSIAPSSLLFHYLLLIFCKINLKQAPTGVQPNRESAVARNHQHYSS